MGREGHPSWGPKLDDLRRDKHSQVHVQLSRASASTGHPLLVGLLRIRRRVRCPNTESPSSFHVDGLA